MYRKFSDDLWSMAVNVAGSSPGNLTLPLVQEKQGWMRSLATRISQASKHFGDRFRAYQRYRETFDELSSLDDRQLADIGVRRDEIHRIVALATVGGTATRS